jgi:transketolase
MRKIFSEITDQIIREDEKTVLLLGDIGVFAFRKTIEDFPLRAMNFGIMEQTMISFASGLAKEKFIPIVHTIAPFLVERAYEQLKVDFGYQQLGGNFISVGASNDYSSLGCTHHCPGDVAALLNIPGFEVIVPGSQIEFKEAFYKKYANNNPTYFRLTEFPNSENLPFNNGQGLKLKNGKAATIIAIGPVLDLVLPVTKNLDVEVLYINQIMPFNRELISSNCKSNKILIVEPFYSGTILPYVMESLSGRKLLIEQAGISREFMTDYVTISKQQDMRLYQEYNISDKISKLVSSN